MSAWSLAEIVKKDLARILEELDFLGRLQQKLQGLSGRCRELATILHPLAETGQKCREQYWQEHTEPIMRQQEPGRYENLLSLPKTTVAALPLDQATNEKALFDDNVELF